MTCLGVSPLLVSILGHSTFFFLHSAGVWEFSHLVSCKLVKIKLSPLDFVKISGWWWHRFKKNVFFLILWQKIDSQSTPSLIFNCACKLLNFIMKKKKKKEWNHLCQRFYFVERDFSLHYIFVKVWIQLWIRN